MFLKSVLVTLTREKILSTQHCSLTLTSRHEYIGTSWDRGRTQSHPWARNAFPMYYCFFWNFSIEHPSFPQIIKKDIFHIDSHDQGHLHQRDVPTEVQWMELGHSEGHLTLIEPTLADKGVLLYNKPHWPVPRLTLAYHGIVLCNLRQHSVSQLNTLLPYIPERERETLSCPCA